MNRMRAAQNPHALRDALQADPGAPVHVEIARTDAGVTICVIDHGAGMSADFVRAKLFQPFASTKPAGFGIGAHQARSLIVGMGGALRVDSREGAGTRFTITLAYPPPRELAA